MPWHRVQGISGNPAETETMERPTTMNYYNDNDITAASRLNDEDRALDAVLARIEDALNWLGDIPSGGKHFKYLD